MKPEEFARIGKRLYGKIHWRKQLALNLGLNVSTIWRYSGKVPLEIPHLVEVAVKGLLAQHKALIEIEKATAARMRAAGIRVPLKRKKKKIPRPYRRKTKPASTEEAVAEQPESAGNESA